jgi:hypothetical protein
LNKTGGHAVNASNDAMVGVLSLRLGNVANLKNTHGGKVYVTVSYGKQTFKTGWADEEQLKNEWEDYCHVWLQEHQLNGKVLISVYSGNSKLVGLNYISPKDLFAASDPKDRFDKPVRCLLFPENTFRGQKYDEKENLGLFELNATYVTRSELVKSYWKWIFDLADPNNEGALDLEAFTEMVALKEEPKEEPKEECVTRQS